jgi:uncharacterized membrane protein YcaP (DUF421 family)
VTAEVARLLVVVGKSIGLYALALAGFRLMGKRCLGDMEPLDFVLVLIVAEVVGAPLADPSLALLPPIAAVVTLTLVQLGLTHLSVTYAPVQDILEGRPVMVIREGRILEDNLRRARVSPAELAERLRERGFIGAEDVELAIFETDGMLSTIRRREAAPITPRSLGLEASTLLFLRGKPEADGLGRAGMSEADLERALARRGLAPADVEEVFLDPGGNLHVTLSLATRKGRTAPSRSSKAQKTSSRPGPDGSP